MQVDRREIGTAGSMSLRLGDLSGTFGSWLHTLEGVRVEEEAANGTRVHAVGTPFGAT
jgi:hypothetical protein